MNKQFFVSFNTLRRFTLSIVAMLVPMLSQAAFAQTYINLLDAPELNHWMKPNGDPVGEGWALEPGGVLHLSGKGGNILSRQQYGDFELWFEFRNVEKGNNGIKYRVAKYDNQWLGLEYQLLDDTAFPKLGREHLTGSLYDIIPPIPSVTRLHAIDEYNVGKIMVRNNRVQHWINGQILIDEQLGTDRWFKYFGKSKFKDREGFALNPQGHLMLTDHGSQIWFKNMFLRKLNTVECSCNN